MAYTADGTAFDTRTCDDGMSADTVTLTIRGAVDDTLLRPLPSTPRRGGPDTDSDRVKPSMPRVDPRRESLAVVLGRFHDGTVTVLGLGFLVAGMSAFLLVSRAGEHERTATAMSTLS